MTKTQLILLSSLFISAPAFAGGTVTYQRGYSHQESCYRYEYNEEYIPGTSQNPGYVRSYREKVEVPCKGSTSSTNTNTNRVDDNSCVEGSVLGGIAGGGVGAVLSRGSGRWWAIPLGVITGAMAGCQVDGG